jgi:hypothetical protein
MKMKNIKKGLALVLACLGGLGILASQGSTASALVCDAPMVEAGNPAVYPVTQLVTIACQHSAAGVAASMRSVGTANDAQLKSFLISGSTGVTSGYTSARAVLGGCSASDSTPNSGTVTAGSCSGVRFKDIFVLN